jgi:hypothetical protein
VRRARYRHEWRLTWAANLQASGRDQNTQGKNRERRCTFNGRSRQNVIAGSTFYHHDVTQCQTEHHFPYCPMSTSQLHATISNPFSVLSITGQCPVKVIVVAIFGIISTVIRLNGIASPSDGQKQRISGKMPARFRRRAHRVTANLPLPVAPGCKQRL